MPFKDAEVQAPPPMLVVCANKGAARRHDMESREARCRFMRLVLRNKSRIVLFYAVIFSIYNTGLDFRLCRA
jgi:hypothetical protein